MGNGFRRIFRRVDVTSREWALFATRWAVPLGLALFIVESVLAHTLSAQVGGLVAAVALLAIISNLVVLALLLNNQWLVVLNGVMVGIDAILAVAAVAVSNITVGWVGLIPVAVAGFYFGWIPGLLVGVLVALSIIAAQFMNLQFTTRNIPSLVLVLIAIPAVGPVAYFLGSDKSEATELREQMKSRGKRTEQITRMATEYMRVIYEMTEVLSASKLDPKRVLQAAVQFSVEALQRVGTPPPSFSAILLFSNAGDNVGKVLKVVRASETIHPRDLRLSIPASSGIIAETLEKQAPTLSHAPDTDPELRLFETFGRCKTVLCTPLGSGNEVYGVMLIGNGEPDAFREMHVELMRAVANQAAASLNNARLYGSLLEQRDRMVEVEKNTRAQLASELHDGPTQGVAAITMQLNVARKLVDKKPESAVDALYKLEDLARRTSKEMRHMLFELRPMALEQGLGAGLEQLAIKMKDTYEQNVVISVDPAADRSLDSQTAQTLFSIASETVNNARKHAKAASINVKVITQDKMLVMEVWDNGVGFDVERALAAARTREGHMGLVNLQERARLAEGSLDLWSETGNGSRTTVTIPLEILELKRQEESEREQGKRDEAVPMSRASD